MTILENLAGIDGTRLAIVGTAARLSYADLAAQALAIAPALSGARVVVNYADIFRAAVTIIAADGRSSAVALMSPMHAAEVLVPLMSVVGPDFVLSDKGEALRALGLSVPVVASPADLVGVAGDAGGGAGIATRWIMTTSGTTSTPKLVEHSLASLTRTTRRDTDKGRGQVWGMIYDYTRFAGLQVVLQSLLSGACLAVPDREASLEAQLAFLAEVNCTHLSATPTMWRKIMMSANATALKLQQVTLGGEIADEAILAALSRAYPEARISQIYASTEAGVGLSVTDRRVGFPASYLDEPPAGIGLKIEHGRLWVRNSEVGQAYLCGTGTLGADGWVDTGDLVEQRGDRVFFKGRETGVINVGGNKVHPEEVERAILLHPHVLMARVYSKSNPITGALVVADIVPAPDAPETLQKDLGTFLSGRLARYMIPVSFRVKSSFEVNAAGKIRRDTQQ